MTDDRSKRCLFTLAILANCEKSPAILIVDQFVQLAYPLPASTKILRLENCCRLLLQVLNASFIGVRGFFISCATCRAISRHAPSLSLLARAFALSASFLPSCCIRSQVRQAHHFSSTDFFIRIAKTDRFHFVTDKCEGRCDAAGNPYGDSPGKNKNKCVQVDERD